MCAEAARGPTAGLEVAVTRLAGALRRLDLGRLSRPPRLAPRDGGSSLDEGDSVADRAYLLSCALAALQADAGDDAALRGAGPGESAPRPPRLGDHGSADQLEVVGRDAVAALHDSAASASADVVAQVVGLTEQLRELRLQL